MVPDNGRKSLTTWIEAARPRTLPLALSSTTLGSCLAASDRGFNWEVFVLASVTTVLLQVLSNLANDYGDFINGKDTAQRIGPPRMVQSGQIAPRSMVRALVALVIITLASGTALVVAGTYGAASGVAALYFLMGIGAITAAMRYTVGNNPYGYRGLGDVSVFIFFGLLGTLGTYYLHTHHLKLDLLLPAASVGLLSTGVLNLNNMRDEQSDRQANKRTFVIIIGGRKAKFYHMGLVVSAVIAGLAYTLLNYRSGFQFLFLIPLPLLYQNIMTVFRNTRPAELNAELKRLSLSTFLFAVTFGAGILIP
jgi:1,4-dihydroxy-2-naphthoate polyprenyltransferase